MTKAVVRAAVLASLVVALTGCGRSAPWTRAAGPPAPPPADAGDSGYREPPQVRRAQRGSDGAVILSGQALPGATLRLASPDGRHEQTQADDSGAWALMAPPGGPAIYGLSQDLGGRRDQAQGYLAVLPSGEPAAVELRSGAGAISLARPVHKPVITAIDFDSADAAVVSGWAGANQPLRVLIDGVSVEEGMAEADGRFSLSLPKPLAGGVRSVKVICPTGEADVSIDVTSAAAFNGVLHASHDGASWRLDWVTPSGGVQSTQLYETAEPGR